MSYCNTCIHHDVCGMEGVDDEGMTYCADRLEPREDAISRDAVISIIEENKEDDADEWMGYPWKVTPNLLMDEVRKLPPVTPQEPSKDMVSRGVFEQVMWERDVAIDQLKELGYGFGEKPRTGHWIECEDEVKVYCSECKEISDYPTNYCPNCGADMQESEEQE